MKIFSRPREIIDQSYVIQFDLSRFASRFTRFTHNQRPFISQYKHKNVLQSLDIRWGPSMSPATAVFSAITIYTQENIHTLFCMVSMHEKVLTLHYETA